jgi:hypothetical protein
VEFVEIAARPGVGVRGNGLVAELTISINSCRVMPFMNIILMCS